MSEDKKPNGIKFSPWWITGAILFMLIVLNMIGGSTIQDYSKISVSQFDDMLKRGEVQKVIVYNKTKAEAYLTEKALKEKKHQKVAKDVFGTVNKGPHYTFDIGNDELFQKELAEALQKNAALSAQLQQEKQQHEAEKKKSKENYDQLKKKDDEIAALKQQLALATSS